MAADSTSAQRRRVTKPLMEKKRRARINSCLAELKRIVTEKEGTVDQMEGRTSRLEKADILEMTVRFLRKSNHDSKTAGFQTNTEVPKTNSAYDSSFNEGFKFCILQVEKFLTVNQHLWTDDESFSSVMIHLQQYLLTMQTTSQFDSSSRCSSTSSSSSSLCTSPTTTSPDNSDSYCTVGNNSDSYCTVGNKSGENRTTRHQRNNYSFVPFIVGFRNISKTSSTSSTVAPLHQMKRNNVSVNEACIAQSSSSAVWRPWDSSYSEKRD